MMPPEEPKELQSKESQRGRKRATVRQSHLARKKQKRDEIFDNLEAVLATHDSPLFKDNVNLKVLFSFLAFPHCLLLGRTSYYIQKHWQYSVMLPVDIRTSNPTRCPLQLLRSKKMVPAVILPQIG